MPNIGPSEDPIRDEVEFARAVAAVILAIKLDAAEKKADDAYERLVHPGDHPQEDREAV